MARTKKIEVTYPEGVLVAKKESFFKFVIKNKWLYIFILPALLYLLVFKYVPMFGIVMAFQKFNMVKGLFGSEFIGFDNFKIMFTDPTFYGIFKNSIIISFYNIIFGFPAPIILAVLLNEVKHAGYKKLAQTVFYLPHFVSWVVVSGMLINFLAPSGGLVNFIITKLGGDMIPFLQDPKYFRGIIVISGIWKTAGWGTIIYLAAMSNLDVQVYEAALIDGANRFQRMRYITLPGIMSTIVMMFILRMGSVLNNGFEQIFLLQNSLNLGVSDVFETYTYRIGLMLGQYSFSSAVGLFQSVVAFIFVMSTNKLSNMVGEKGLW